MFSKRVLLTIVLNAFLVGVSLLLAHRMFAPVYQREETSSLTTLGKIHTELAAERLASRITFLRDELKENALRLVDESRGPVFLDPARWYWMRVQDRDWRAPNYLDALPAQRTDVDTWVLSAAKNSLVISQRVPIVKDGVQDFVLIEGGIKNTTLNDLQNDERFGFWVFDLAIYKKSGISAAKLFERMSSSGSLSKDEIPLMTSDFLTNLFEGKESVFLPSTMPWFLYFKKPVGSENVGILGFWSADVPAPDMFDTWLMLGGVLTALSLLVSLILLKLTRPEVVEEEDLSPATRAQPKFVANASVPNASHDSHSDIRNFLQTFSNYSRFTGQEFPFAKQIGYFLGEDDPSLDNIDFEILFKEFERSDPVFQGLDPFFDPGLWRALTDPSQLRSILAAFITFLEKFSDARPRLAARFVSVDKNEPHLILLQTSKSFRVPFVRITLQGAAPSVLTDEEIHSAFHLGESTNFEHVPLALSMDLIDKLQARVCMKSNVEDGNVIYIDLPATEARKPEDLIYIRQLNGISQAPAVESVAQSESQEQKGMDEAAIIPTAPLPDPTDTPFAPVQTLTDTQLQELESHDLADHDNVGDVDADKIEEPKAKALPMTEIKKSKSFAEDIGDERSRVRSRFKIRKPGEKE